MTYKVKILYMVWNRKNNCILFYVLFTACCGFYPSFFSLYLHLQIAVLMPSYSFSLPLIRRHMLAIFSFQPLHRLGHERFHFCTFHPTIFPDLSTLS